MNKVVIKCAMMVKNEETNILRSLNSIKELDGLILFDTGSTDKTIEITEKWCKENNLSFELLKGQFVDFSVSRNKLLDFCVGKADWLVLLDANDELQGASKLRDFLKTVKDENGITRDAIYIRQKWKISTDNYMIFKNHRVIRADTTMRYICVVHECLVESKPELQKKRIEDISPEGIFVYQDRLLDTTMSSEARWHRDQKLLQKAYDNQPSGKKDPRTVFYLAQTYKCLRKFRKAIEYYTERATLIGFLEEVYVSCFEVGSLSNLFYHQKFEEIKDEKPKIRENRLYQFNQEKQIHYDNFIKYMIKAAELDKRAEPLIWLSKHYLEINNFDLAYMYIHQACRIEEPTKTLLWYDTQVYSYERWHLLGRICYYIGEYERGKYGCDKAIAHSDLQIDKDNLKWYISKLEEKNEKV